jgi:hypothetical protein
MPGGCELTQAVPHHIFRDVNGHVPSAIMDCDGVTHHLRENGARATPGTENFLLALGIHRFYSLQKLWVDERPFFKRS